jgi:hypothetical protein
MGTDVGIVSVSLLRIRDVARLSKTACWTIVDNQREELVRFITSL